MFITTTAILYLILIIPLVLLFQKILSPTGAILIFNAILIIIAIIDFKITPSMDKIKFNRFMDEKLSLGTDNKVTFKISNLSPYRIKMEIKDEYPNDFEIDKKRLDTSINGHSSTEIHYSVKPTRRGAYRFGDIYVRVYGILGIVGRQFKVDVSKQIKVYPNIKEISRYKIMARKGRLMEAGLKPMRVYGVGTDFESLREYQPDDEYRKINWKATARRSKLVTSQYQNERSQNIFIAIEAGRMMTSMINNISKFDYALNAALLLGYVAMEKGDNVGIMVFDEDINTFIPCKRGKKHLHLIIESLYKQEPKMVEPDYGHAIRYMSLKNRKRSLVVFFTDLIDTDVSKGIVTYTRALYPTHLPLCVAVSDPELFEELEIPPGSSRNIYRRAVAEDLIAQREQVKTVLQKGGVMTLDVHPKHLTPALISRYLTIKARARL
ncbi:MAG: DUF58 domain-containing protein [Candidatus Eremiobacteraeota bacterium]|nr:DUF58 domain-containing protein [Candidatus Eremiobacteraeota bacterium]